MVEVPLPTATYVVIATVETSYVAGPATPYPAVVKYVPRPVHVSPLSELVEIVFPPAPTAIHVLFPNVIPFPPVVILEFAALTPVQVVPSEE